MSVIQTRDLSRQYEMGSAIVHALRGVNVEVEAGDFIALMGASGSGKSTLLSLLGLLDTPTAGEYWLEEVNVSSLNRNAQAEIRSQRIGIIFQNFNLLPRLSAWENVSLPLTYRKGQFRHTEQRTRALQALERVGLTDRADHHPMELSGGERQRVAIARALITQPAVILADEPTGNLDSANGVEIMRLLGELHTEGSTIVMVTHDTHIAGYANRVCTMQDGELKE